MSDDYLLLSDILARRLTVGLALTDRRERGSPQRCRPLKRVLSLPDEILKTSTKPERQLGVFRLLFCHFGHVRDVLYCRDARVR